MEGYRLSLFWFFVLVQLFVESDFSQSKQTVYSYTYPKNVSVIIQIDATRMLRTSVLQLQWSRDITNGGGSFVICIMTVHQTLWLCIRIEHLSVELPAHIQRLKMMPIQYN